MTKTSQVKTEVTLRGTLNRVLLITLGLVAGDKVHVTQGEAHAVLAARLDKTLAPTVVRVPAGHVLTAGLGASFGAISVVKA